MVIASKKFKFAHGGHTVRQYEAGEVLPADAAFWALGNGYAEEEPEPEQVEEDPEPVKASPSKRGRKNKS